MKIKNEMGEEIEIYGNSLEGANFGGLNLHRAILICENMTGASFVGSNLRNACLNDSKMIRCDLSKVPMMNALLRRTDLSDSLLVYSSLVGAILDQANLCRADLTGADVAWASFRACKLWGTKMLCSRLDEISLNGATFTQDTSWPNDFDPESKGAIFLREV